MMVSALRSFASSMSDLKLEKLATQKCQWAQKRGGWTLRKACSLQAKDQEGAAQQNRKFLDNKCLLQPKSTAKKLCSPLSPTPAKAKQEAQTSILTRYGVPQYLHCGVPEKAMQGSRTCMLDDHTVPPLYQRTPHVEPGPPPGSNDAPSPFPLPCVRGGLVETQDFHHHPK